VLAGQPEPPKYFAKMKRINKEGPPILGRFHTPQKIDRAQLPALIEKQELVIDTRTAADYAAGHVPGTINIPLSSSFVSWAGWLVDTGEVYLIVDASTASARLNEVSRALALIGIDRIAGYFEGAASMGRATISQITPKELATKLTAVTVIDVRSANEWSHGHLPGAKHIPLGYLIERLGEIPGDKPVVVQCQSGGRSQIAASILERAGFSGVANLTGGLSAWMASGLAVEEAA
jgi:hydroxyacylglutathione hydrolase